MKPQNQKTKKKQSKKRSKSHCTSQPSVNRKNKKTKSSLTRIDRRVRRSRRSGASSPSWAAPISAPCTPNCSTAWTKTKQTTSKIQSQSQRARNATQTLEIQSPIEHHSQRKSKYRNGILAA